MKNSLATARAKVAETKDQDEIIPQDEDDDRSPAQNASSNPFAGLGGGGGMPDLASLMNNPMIMQMAQQMMANGGLESLMK
jgi:small glutamine-rich tetratricopeptide repeat-containing protein alpha